MFSLNSFLIFDMNNFYKLDTNTKKVNPYHKAIGFNSIFVLNFSQWCCLPLCPEIQRKWTNWKIKCMVNIYVTLWVSHHWERWSPWKRRCTIKLAPGAHKTHHTLIFRHSASIRLWLHSPVLWPSSRWRNRQGALFLISAGATSVSLSHMKLLSTLIGGAFLSRGLPFFTTTPRTPFC